MHRLDISWAIQGQRSSDIPPLLWHSRKIYLLWPWLAKAHHPPWRLCCILRLVPPSNSPGGSPQAQTRVPQGMSASRGCLLTPRPLPSPLHNKLPPDEPGTGPSSGPGPSYPACSGGEGSVMAATMWSPASLGQESPSTAPGSASASIADRDDQQNAGDPTTGCNPAGARGRGGKGWGMAPPWRVANAADPVVPLCWASCPRTRLCRRPATVVGSPLPCRASCGDTAGIAHPMAAPCTLLGICDGQWSPRGHGARHCPVLPWRASLPAPCQRISPTQGPADALRCSLSPGTPMPTAPHADLVWGC